MKTKDFFSERLGRKHGSVVYTAKYIISLISSSSCLILVI